MHTKHTISMQSPLKNFNMKTAAQGFSPLQEGLPKLLVRNKTVSLESVPISYLTMQRMSLSLLWPFPSHILRPPFPSRLVFNCFNSLLKKKKNPGSSKRSLILIISVKKSLFTHNNTSVVYTLVDIRYLIVHAYIQYFYICIIFP